MKIGVISDIHGNCLALDAVLHDLRSHPIDRLVCLGDAIQGGPQPADVVQRLRELDCPVVMGNADAFLLSGDDDGEATSPDRLAKLRAVREWSLGKLTDRDRRFIRGFQPTVTITGESGLRLLCFHGSPASYNDIILPSTPDADVDRFLGNHVPDFMAGGHTHLQQIRRLGPNFFFNPGSVGFAYSPGQSSETLRADPWAEYAVLTLEPAHSSLEFRRVPFDAAELRRIFLASGRPYADEAAAQYQ